MSGSRIDLADRFTRQWLRPARLGLGFFGFRFRGKFPLSGAKRRSTLAARTAWGEKNKTGSLSEWEWKQISETEAQYTETKWVENEEQARVVSKRRRAVRV